jgi:hypothetical protein
MVPVPGDPSAQARSEYSDVRGAVSRERVRELGWASLAKERAGEHEGLGSRIGSLASRVMGGPTPEEIHASRLARHEATWSYRYDQVFASNIADAVSSRPEAHVRHMVPGLDGAALPAQKDVRWLAVAKGALDVAHAHVERGDDHGLGADLGRAVRMDVLAREARSERPWSNALSAAQKLEKDAAAQSIEVRNYLSAGPEVMSAITRQAMSLAGDARAMSSDLGISADAAPEDPINRQAWVRDRLVERHAKARAGGTSDPAIMLEARSLAGYGQLRGDHSRDGTFVRPDTARTATRIAERDASQAGPALQADRAQAPVPAAARAASQVAERGR